MSDLSKAVEDLKWLSDRLGGLIALAPTLDSVDALTNQTTAMQNSVDKSRSDLQSAKDEQLTVRAQIADDLAVIDAKKKSADEDVANMLSDAKSQASSLIQDAKNKIKGMLDSASKAKADADAEIVSKQAVISDLNSTADNLNNTISKLRIELENIKARF